MCFLNQLSSQSAQRSSVDGMGKFLMLSTRSEGGGGIGSQVNLNVPKHVLNAANLADSFDVPI